MRYHAKIFRLPHGLCQDALASILELHSFAAKRDRNQAVDVDEKSRSKDDYNVLTALGTAFRFCPESAVISQTTAWLHKCPRAGPSFYLPVESISSTHAESSFPLKMLLVTIDLDGLARAVLFCKLGLPRPKSTSINALVSSQYLKRLGERTSAPISSYVLCPARDTWITLVHTHLVSFLHTVCSTEWRDSRDEAARACQTFATRSRPYRRHYQRGATNHS